MKQTAFNIKINIYLLVFFVFFTFEEQSTFAQNSVENNKLHNISLYLGGAYNKIGDLQNQHFKFVTGIDYELKIPGVENLGLGATVDLALIGETEISAFIPIYIYSNNQRFKIFFAPGVVNYKGIANKINYLPNQTFPDEEKKLTAIAFRIGAGYQFYLKRINLTPKISYDFYNKFANLNIGCSIGYKL